MLFGRVWLGMSGLYESTIRGNPKALKREDYLFHEVERFEVGDRVFEVLSLVRFVYGDYQVKSQLFEIEEGISVYGFVFFEDREEVSMRLHNVEYDFQISDVIDSHVEEFSETVSKLVRTSDVDLSMSISVQEETPE